MNKSPSNHHLLWVAIVLVAFFAIRGWNLDQLPLFIDETLAIQRAESTMAGNPLFFASQGKVLLPWVAAPFISGEAEYIVIRYVTLLVVMLGAASAVALAKHLHSWRAAYLTIFLLASNPMLHFYDRLALSDTTLHALLTLFALSLLYLYQRRDHIWRGAIIAGCIFVAALLAKATALVMLPLPLVAVVLIPRGWSLMKRGQSLLGVYGTIAALWLPFYNLALLRDVNYFGRAQRGTSNNLLDLQQIADSASFMLEGMIGYLGILFPILVVGGLAAVVFRPRRALFLLTFSISFTVAIALVGGNLYTRYWMTSLPALTVLLAVAVVSVYDVIPRKPIRLIALIGTLSFWTVSTAPFIMRSYYAPITLNLPETDAEQYLYYDSAGTGIDEIAHHLATLTHNTPIVGAFVGCESLSYYIPADVPLRCVPLTGNESQRIQRINDRIDAAEFVILESPGYITTDMIQRPLEEMITVERPGGISTLTIYRVMP